MENNITDFSAFRSIGEIIMDLKKPIALKHLKKRSQGKTQILYISWHDAVKYMDYYANGWFNEIRRIESIGGKLITTVRVYIPAKEGIFWREATGQEEESTDSWGDSSSNAESMAIRRAFAKFGLGLYLYDLTDAEKAKLLSGQQIEVATPLPKTPNSAITIQAPEGADITEAVKDAVDEVIKQAQKPNTAQTEGNGAKVEAALQSIRIAHQKLVALGVKAWEQKKGEKDADYLERLRKQYKAIAAAPSVLTDDEKQAFKKNEAVSGTIDLKQSETATGSQVETLEMLAKKAKVSQIDVVQEISDGRAETFEDLSQAEADALIKQLSAQLTGAAKAKAKKYFDAVLLSERRQL